MKKSSLIFADTKCLCGRTDLELVPILSTLNYHVRGISSMEEIIACGTNCDYCTNRKIRPRGIGGHVSLDAKTSSARAGKHGRGADL